MDETTVTRKEAISMSRTLRWLVVVFFALPAVIAARPASGFPPPRLVAPAFSDANRWNTDASYYSTIQFVNLNDDVWPDVCGRGIDGIYCALGTGSTFGPATLWSSAFSDANGWTSHGYYSTIQFADVDGDGRPDVCGRGREGIYCALNVGGTAFGPATLWSDAFSDANGWADRTSYYSTIRFIRLDGDFKVDVCGRGREGIYCALSNGMAFGPATVWNAAFSDANGWDSDPAYYSTIQFVDLNGDFRWDVCARGRNGLGCALSNGTSFGPLAMWSDQFSDRLGWNLDPSYYGTIEFVHLFDDARLHVCARTSGGIGCAESTGTSFGPLRLWSGAFSDANGWRNPAYYTTIRYVLTNNGGVDTKTDVCARGTLGVYCAFNTGTAFGPPTLVAPAFSDANGWGSHPAYYSTVQPYQHFAYCGRGVLGLFCTFP